MTVSIIAMIVIGMSPLRADTASGYTSSPASGRPVAPRGKRGRAGIRYREYLFENITDCCHTQSNPPTNRFIQHWSNTTR